MRIFLADDDAEDRLIISESFEELGLRHAIHMVEDGVALLKTLKETQPDYLPCLIVLDLNMPLMNGTETLREIKANELYRNIPVVIYSTSVNEYEKEKCLAMGALEFISKPFRYTEALQIARRFCAISGIEELAKVP